MTHGRRPGSVPPVKRSPRGAAGRGVALLVLWLAALVLSPAPDAAAHAFLASSTPAANAILPSEPGSVTLRFTEPLETSYSRADLFDQTGAQVPGATSTIEPDGRTMTVGLPGGLRNGTYSLLWRTLSTADGHTAQGYLPFTIGTQADVQNIAPPVESALVLGPPEWARAASRWLALLGLAAVIAIWPVWLFVVRPAIGPVWQLGPRVMRRVGAYTAAAFAFAIVADVIALIVQSLSIADPANFLGGLATTLTETRYGTWWLLRVGFLLIFAAMMFGAAWWWQWRRRGMTYLLLAAGATLPLPFSMISHAGAEPAGQAVAVAFDYAHLLGASLWTGGLLFLVVALAPAVRNLTGAGRRVVLGRALPRFSLLALIAWGVLLLTGIYSSWLQVGNLPALTSTPYGQTLILKLILLIPLLGLGAFNLAVVTRKLRAAETEERAEGWGSHFVTALMAEVVIVTLLLGVVGMLIGTPPARQVMQQESGRIRIPLEAANQIGALLITPGTVGQNHYQLELGSGHEAHLRNPSITDATLRFELPSRQTGQIDVPLRASPGGGYEGHGAELAFPGDWHIQVTVTMPGQPDWVATATQSITAEPPPSQAPPPAPLFAPIGIAALILLVLGIAGIVFAVMASTPVFRKEAAGLGAAAIIVGAVLLLQARLPAQAASVAGPEATLAALDPAAVTRGSALFAQNCAVCHGPDAKGDGPGAGSLKQRPADLTGGHSLLHTDDDYAYWVENGIAGTDMPSFAGKLNADQIRDVIAYVRGLQQQALLARDAPGAEACTVAPRSLDDIAGLAKTPPAAEPPNATETGGAPADETTRGQIVAVAREMVACANAGDILRRLALYSDDRLRFAYPQGPTSALKAIAEKPLPVSEVERVALVSVDDVRRLDDGRVSARVIVDNPGNHSHDPNATSTTQQEAARLIFVQSDGRWLVDESHREELQLNATPVAGSTGS
jgi:copper transport protein